MLVVHVLLCIPLVSLYFIIDSPGQVSLVAELPLEMQGYRLIDDCGSTGITMKARSLSPSLSPSLPLYLIFIFNRVLLIDLLT